MGTLEGSTGSGSSLKHPRDRATALILISSLGELRIELGTPGYKASGLSRIQVKIWL